MKKCVIRTKHIGFTFLKRNKLKRQKQAIRVQKLRVLHENSCFLPPKTQGISP